MTRDEYIKWLKQLDENLKFDGLIDGDKAVDLHEMIFDLCEMLEQQTCEDAVSRQAVLDIFADNADATRPYSTAWEEVKALPPVNPQPKTDVFDKIIAEIEGLTITEGGDDYIRKMAELYSLKIKVLQIIDKYRSEISIDIEKWLEEESEEK